MNLILAVIIFSFIKTQKMEIEDEIKQLKNEDIKLDTPPTEMSNTYGGGGLTLQSQAIEVIPEDPEGEEKS